MSSFFGTTAVAKGFFGDRNIDSVFQPPAYDLDFFNYTGIGLHSHHFRNDWRRTGPAGSEFNYTQPDGSIARLGDPVSRWKNVGHPIGVGDLVAPSQSSQMQGGNYWDFSGEEIGYPILDEKNYGGRKYPGLRFTGHEYLELDSSFLQYYGLNYDMFTTGGSSYMSSPYTNTGASFLLVIDADWTQHYIPYNEHDPNFAEGIDINAPSPVQTLLYSRQPLPAVLPYSYIEPPWHPKVGNVEYSWPETEDRGIQFFYMGGNVKTNPNNYIHYSWGPDAVQPGIYTGIPPAPQVPPLPSVGPSNSLTEIWKCPEGVTGDDCFGGSHVDWLPFYPQDQFGFPAASHVLPCCLKGGSTGKRDDPMPGFQILLLEYDNTDILDFDADDPDHSPFINDRDYSGPTVKVYALGNLDTAGQGWGLSDFHKPKLISRTPALSDHILFSANPTTSAEKKLFVGGVPPVRLCQQTWNMVGQACNLPGAPFGCPNEMLPFCKTYKHGFRGMIYEFIPFEGKLSTLDKRKLQKITMTKYAQPLSTPLPTATNP